MLLDFHNVVDFYPSNGGFSDFDQVVVSSWYLDKIISPSGEEVNYIYDTVQGSKGELPERYIQALAKIT